jgi:hypothetical protein
MNVWLVREHLAIGHEDNAKLFMRTVAFPPKPVLAEIRQIRPAGAISDRSTQRAAEPAPSRGIGFGAAASSTTVPSTPALSPVLLKSAQGVLGANGAGNNRPSFHARSTRECAQSVSFRPFQYDAGTRGLPLSGR